MRNIVHFTADASPRGGHFHPRSSSRRCGLTTFVPFFRDRRELEYNGGDRRQPLPD